MFFFKTIYSFLQAEEYRDLILTTLIVLGLGTVVYHFVEGWRWIDSFYFSVITLTTVGYGDMTPQTDAGKLFTVFYILIGIGIILTFINAVYFHYDSLRNNEGKKSN